VPPEIPLNSENLLLRGTALKNTEVVYGIVVFTGHNTKIMHNQAKSKYKYSKTERIMNRQIIWVIILQIIMCLFCALYGTFWEKHKLDGVYYLSIDYSTKEMEWSHWFGTTI
jgi:magnesium-transporting ATPase (P-type)